MTRREVARPAEHSQPLSPADHRAPDPALATPARFPAQPGIGADRAAGFIAGLQRGAGNAAVARWLSTARPTIARNGVEAKTGSPDGGDPALETAARPVASPGAATVARLSQGGGNRAVVARIEDSALAGPEIVRGWEGEADAKVSINLLFASDEEKLAEIRRLSADPNPRVAPKTLQNAGEADTSGWAIGRIWRSFGPDLWKIALANRALFEGTLSRNRDIFSYDEGWEGLKERFKEAVEDRVRDNLFKNRVYVLDEMHALGLSVQLAGDELLRPERDRGLREMQVKAGVVGKAQEGMTKARRLPLGQRVVTEDEHFREIRTVYFDPENKPAPPLALRKGDQDWATVKQEYDKLALIVRQAVAESPALFALAEDSQQAATAFAGQDAEAARAQLRPLLLGLLAKIDGANGLVGDDLDYREMGPVHQQLMQTPEWGGELERRLIQTAIFTHNRDKTLRSLGLSALAALGFMFATFATGGAAVFFAVAGATASGVQAGLSIEDYYDKAKAREARTGNPALDIMSQKAVDSAFTQAVLDTVLALIDGWMLAGEVMKLSSPAMKMIQAGEAGARAGAELSVKEALRAGDTASQATAIERAVAEIGTEGVVRATGRSADELAKLLPAESEAAKRLLAASQAAKAGVKGADDLSARLGKLVQLDKDAAAKALAEGFDRIGYIGTIEAAGGWKAVTQHLGEGHPIVTRLEAWRSGIVQEGVDFIRTSSKGESSAVRTGTEKGTSDVDISTFGRDAAQNVDRLKEFLAQRTNVPRKRLEFLLDADAAVNPSRMHLQDIARNLSPAMHNQILAESTRHQEQLIFARRWHDARRAGDGELMRQLDQAAEKLGLGKINKGWEPMAAGTVAALEQQLDGWAAALAKLEAAGASETARRPLIEKIGRGQAELLANNPNMYWDMGNIKTLVTRRDIDLAKIERALGHLDDVSLARLGTVFTHERYLKILGEGPHIDHALQAIKLGTGDAEQVASIAGALKAFAKHGERVIQNVGADVAHGIRPHDWVGMYIEFGRIMNAAKKGELVGQVTKDLAVLQKMVAAQADLLQAGMTTAARALRAQAGMGAALTAHQSAGLTAWARAEATTRLQAEALKRSLEQLHKGVLAGRVAAAAVDVVVTPDEPESKAAR